MSRKRKIAFIVPGRTLFPFTDTNKRLVGMVSRTWLRLAPRNSTIYSLPYIGMLNLASYTPEEEFDMVYLDERVDKIDFNEKYDVVAITGPTCRINRGYEIADHFRSRGSTVVMGGSHVSYLYQEAKQHADSVVMGVGEIPWQAFIKDYLNDDIKPFYNTNEIFDLRKARIPRYDLLDPRKHGIFPVQFSRGCPLRCEFCEIPVMNPNFRTKSLDQMFNEIDALRRIWKRPRVGFVDDNMFTNRKAVKELLKALAKEKGIASWFTASDVSIAEDDELLDLMFEANCRFINIGFETLSAGNLDLIDKFKRSKLEMYTEYARKIVSKGIMIIGSFIVGYDHDDYDVFDRISQFRKDAMLLRNLTLVLTPLPGTALYHRLEKEGRIEPGQSWDKFNFWDVVIKLKKMEKDKFYQKFIEFGKKEWNDDEGMKRQQFVLDAYRRKMAVA